MPRTSRRWPRSAAASTRLATGERCYTKYHLQALLRDCEVGVLQPDIMHVGGILEAKKIAAIADASYIPVSYHNPFGPVATAAALQLDACTTNFIMQESFCEFGEPWRFDLLEQAPRPVQGQYEIPDGPGSGSASSRSRWRRRTRSTRTPSCRCGATSGASAFRCQNRSSDARRMTLSPERSGPGRQGVS